MFESETIYVIHYVNTSYAIALLTAVSSFLYEQFCKLSFIPDIIDTDNTWV